MAKLNTTKEKTYLIITGIERGKTRYEAGDIVTKEQLRGWGIADLLNIGAIKEVDDGR